MVYTCNGILFSLKKERKSAMDGSNMDEPRGFYAKWNKPVAKRQILHDSTYISQNQRKKAEWWLPGSGGWEVGRDVIV